MNEEFNNRYQNKFFGPYRGMVKDINDPKQLGRIKVYVAAIHGIDYETGEQPTSGWAWPMAGGGGFNSGMLFLPAVDDIVWVQFEQGDMEKPIWSHGAWTLKGGENNFPVRSRGKYDAQDNKMRDIEGLVPKSALDSEYGSIRSITTAAGHRIEFDDKSGSERVLIEHKSGSRMEFLSDGSIHLISDGNKREVFTGSETKHIVGKSKETIEGTTTKVHKKKRTVTDQSEYEYINISGATYQYKKLSVQSGNENKVISGPQVIQVTGTRQTTVGNAASDQYLDKYNALIVETAKWIMTGASRITPGESATMHLLNPVAGDMAFRVGVDPTDTANNLLLLRHPIGKIPGASDIVLKAVAIMALTAPLVTVGPTETIVGKEPVAKALSLITAFNLHTHVVPTGVSGPPLPPLTNLIASGLGNPAIPLGLWTV